MNSSELYATCTTCNKPVFPHPYRHPITRESALVVDELQPERADLTAEETAEHRRRAEQIIQRSGNPPVPLGTETTENPNNQEQAA